MRRLICLLFISVLLVPAQANEVYSSEGLGLSLSYPSDWTRRQANFAPFLLTYPGQKILEPALENFHVTVTKLSGNLGYSSFMEMDRRQVEDQFPGIKLVKSKPQKLGKIKDAQRFEFAGKYKGREMKILRIIAFSDDKLYKLSFTANKYNYSKLISKVEGIIRSFKLK